MPYPPGCPSNPRSWRRRLLFALFALFVLIPLLIRKPNMAQAPAQPPLPFPYAFLPSPNCDDRPPGVEINCLVLHATVEPTTEGTIGIFLNPAKRVSAHFVVGRDGRVVQMVPIEKRAWHAGVSVLDGVPRVNDYSVGIEMVNLNDGKDPFTEAQLQSVVGIIRFLRSRYNIPDNRIVSHAQVALPTGRKSDPVGFDFDHIRTLAAQDPTKPVPVLDPTKPVPPPDPGKP